MRSDLARPNSLSEAVSLNGDDGATLAALADTRPLVSHVDAAFQNVATRVLTDAVLMWGSALGMGTVVELYADMSSAVAAASEAGLVTGLQPPASDCLRGLRVSLREQMTRAAVLWAAYETLEQSVGGSSQPPPAPLVARARELAGWAASVFKPAESEFSALVESMTKQLSAEIVLGAGAAFGVTEELAEASADQVRT